MSDTNSTHLYGQDATGAGPFAQAAWAYHNSGWSPIPLPAGRKSPPPGRYTGWAGVAPSGADIQAWLDEGRGAGNIGLTLRGSEDYSLDVDAYHGGLATLARLVEQAGEPLPDTIASGSRPEEEGSRIYHFRAQLPPGRRWRDLPGGRQGGIEALHRGHRYAVVGPSVHPDGPMYRWFGREDIPHADERTWLPTAWVEVLSEPGEIATGDMASHAQTLAAVDAFAVGERCGEVEATLNKAQDVFSRATTHSLHPDMNGSAWSLVRLAYEGHRGVREALAVHYGAFLAARGDARGEGREVAHREWWRSVRGVVGKTAPAYPGGPAAADPCTASAFDPGIPPGSLPAPTTVSEVSDADPFGPPSSTVTGDDTSPPAEGGSDGGEVAAQPAPSLRDRLLDLAGLRKQRPPAPLIRDVLNLNSESWLIGPPGGFKSFVALDWGCHVATGRAWRGKRVAQGRVLYVAAEGAQALGKRVEAWVSDRGVEPDDLMVLPVPVLANGGSAYGMPQLSAQWYELCGIVADERPALVILDTQARMSAGLEENSATSMGVWVTAVGMLREASRGRDPDNRGGGACILVIHHTGRDGRNARGSSALDGAQDMEWKVSRIGADKGLKARLACDKSKDGSDDLSFAFELRVVNVGVDEDGEPVTSLVLGDDASAEESSGYGAVKAVEREASWLSHAQWIRGVLEIASEDEYGLTLAKCRRIVNEVRKRGDVDPVTEAVFNTTVGREVRAGRLIRPTPGRIALAEPVGDGASPEGSFLQNLVAQCGGMPEDTESPTEII